MRHAAALTAGGTVASRAFAGGVRRVVVVVDRSLARERLAACLLRDTAARGGDAAAVEAGIARVAESVGWSVKTERHPTVHVLTVRRA
jgi:hypothetical protein